jgi:hypothetical protein
MQFCTQLLFTVVSPSDNEAALPLFADSVSEWKELCGACKSTIKHVLAEAAVCVPAVALDQARAIVSRASDMCAAAAAADAPAAAGVSTAELDVCLEV